MSKSFKRYSYETKDVCASRITFDTDGEIVLNISFEGGCDGNLKALSRAIDGMRIKDIIEKFSDIKCDDKDTSCMGQLVIAVKNVKEENQ